MERLEKIANGFIEAKILLAAAELRVFDLLVGGGKSAEEVRQALDGDLRGVEILLDALCAMELVRKEGGRYTNHPDCEAHLVEDSPDHYPSLLRHRNLMFRRWAFLEERVRGLPDPDGSPQRPQMHDPEANENFIRAMYAVAHRGAREVAGRIDMEGVRTLADLGGGPGHHLEAFLHRSPEIEPYLVDLPLTLEVARKVLAASPFRDRIRLVAWDIYADDPPAGLPALDLAFLSQVLHGESETRNRDLFRRLYPVVAPGGRVVVRENLVDQDRTTPAPAALFAVNMLAMTQGGRTFTEAEIAGWGEEAGFAHEGGERIDERSCLVTLRRPR